MTVTVNQIRRGLGSYIATEVMPHIPGGTFKKVAVGTVLDLFLDGMEKNISDQGAMFYTLLGIKDEAGNIDIHKIADKLKANMTDDGTKIDLNILGVKLGDMVLHKRDIDDIVRHIVSA